MDCARNIITAAFPAGKTETTTAPLWQWDYGQVLCITGLDLPAAFEVHFSTNRTGGVSTVAVGADGQVTIPNVLLTIGKNLNAWIYLSDAQGEGETEYSILIPVKARPMPETYDAEVSGEFDDVVRQVSEYAETAQTAADNAGASASAAAASASEAAASASAAETAKNAAETAQGKAEDAQAAAETAAQTATEKARQTAQDAAQAAQSKADAESAAQRAEAAQTGAEGAKADAETAAQDAAQSKTDAESAATRAEQAATSAGQSATAAAGSATTAVYAAQTATDKAGEASASATAAATSKTAAQTAQTAAETAASTATASATTATTKASEAAQSASNAAQSKTDAEAAAARAEQAAASLTVDDALSDSSVNPVQNKVITESVTRLKSQIEALEDLPDRVHQLERVVYDKRYGVSGIGQSASALTRLWDSVGMTAEVGTDGDNSAVVNDFDHAAPFMRRKCVGEWSLVNGHAEFTVNAYYGDSDYAEDGTKGDYVAVECPLSYYYFSDGVLGVSSYKHPGFRPFDIFCRNHNEDDLMEYYYLPAYALAQKDGKAVSLPNLDNFQGSYKQCLDAARTYKNGAVGNLAVIQPAAVNFYEWALATVEFAQQDHQKVMNGCCNLSHNDNDRVTFTDATHVLTSNYQAGRVAGEYILITATSTNINIQQASHKIVSIIRCDENGNEDASGTHQLIEVDDLGKAYVTYDTTGLTEYRIAARPYRTGSCNSVSTPSGSPVSNSDGYHPMKYRWRENVYANQYKTIVDLFNKRVKTGNSDWILEHYYLPNPENYTPANNNKPDEKDLATDDFVKLDVETAHANYVNGYIKTRVQSALYPDIWIPGKTTGGSSTTYFADYASLVISLAVRSVRLGGHWYDGASDGFSAFYGAYPPYTDYAFYGGDLCFIQTGKHEGASPS